VIDTAAELTTKARDGAGGCPGHRRRGGTRLPSIASGRRL